MCRNGEYTERGIKALDGYGSERWRIEPEYAVRLDPALDRVGVLIEPTSVVAKAWDEIDARSRAPARRRARRVITGAGPIGLLAALLAVQRGLETHVLDLVTDGPKPRTRARPRRDLSLRAAAETGLRPDVVVECTGRRAGGARRHARHRRAGRRLPHGGLPRPGAGSRSTPARSTRTMVLENDTFFGSVNAAHQHYGLAATRPREPTTTGSSG